MFNKSQENQTTLKKLAQFNGSPQPVNLTLKLDFTEVFLAQLAIVFLAYWLFWSGKEVKEVLTKSKD